MTRLSDFQIGQRGRVRHVHGSDELGTRLMEMGLTPGVQIALVGKAPLGDPWEFELRGYRLSLRRKEAERVEVEPS